MFLNRNDDILSLKQQVATLASEIEKLKTSLPRNHEEEDPCIASQSPSRIFTLSTEEIWRYLSIASGEPLSFYNEVNDDDNLLEQIHRYPENTLWTMCLRQVPPILLKHHPRAQRSHVHGSA